MPVPSGKEDCANRATIDLLVANSEAACGAGVSVVVTGGPEVLVFHECRYGQPAAVGWVRSPA